MARNLPNLQRHKKRLLSPVSLMEMKSNFPLTRTSWSDLGFYELLWIGLLLQRIGLSDSIEFSAVYGNILRNRSKFDKNIRPDWSFAKSISKNEFFDPRNNRNSSLLHQAWQAIQIQTLIDKYPQITDEEIEIIPELTFIRKLCNKENCFALQVMFISFAIMIYSGKMHVPKNVLREMDPYSLKDYPDSLISCRTAGMLRSNINALAVANSSQSPIITPLPLWKFISDTTTCS